MVYCWSDVCFQFAPCLLHRPALNPFYHAYTHTHTQTQIHIHKYTYTQSHTHTSKHAHIGARSSCCTSVPTPHPSPPTNHPSNSDVNETIMVGDTAAGEVACCIHRRRYGDARQYALRISTLRLTKSSQRSGYCQKIIVTEQNHRKVKTIENEYMTTLFTG